MRRIKSEKCWCVEFADDAQKYEYEGARIKRRPVSELGTQLRTLVDSDPSEEAVQRFFEENPRCLPWTGYYHHGLRADVVISKLPLQNDYVTDFAYMSANSQSIMIICVEIERPGKKIFRKDGNFTAGYLAAKQQVLDWNFWAQHNIRSAFKCFGKLGQFLAPDIYNVKMHCILVVGRRSELSTRKRKERWSTEDATLPKSIEIMTYDRLIDLLESGFYAPDNKKILVCSYRDRALKVKHVTA